MSDRNTKMELSLKKPKTAITWSTPQMIATDELLTCPEFVTLSSPALVAFSSYLYVCFRERDDSLWISASEDGQNFNIGSYKMQKALARGVLRYIPFSPSTDNSIYTLYRPSLTVLSSYVYLAWTNKDDSIIGMAKTSDPSPPNPKNGTNWTVLTSVTTPTTVASGPSIATFNSRIFLTYRDTDSNIYIGSLGGSWSSFQQVQDAYSVAYKSLDGPTLLAVTTGGLTSRLWISFRQVDTFYFGYANFNVNGYTIDSWTMSTITTPCNVVEKVIVSLYGNDLYAAFQGSNQKINFGTSYNGGSSWGDWGLLDNNLCIEAPAITAFGSVLTMAFQAFAPDNTRKFIMTCYHDFSAEKKEKTSSSDKTEEKQEDTSSSDKKEVSTFSFSKIEEKKSSTK